MKNQKITIDFGGLFCYNIIIFKKGIINMTNKEYIEKNNISFSEAMKMWDNQTNHIEDWLNQEHNTWKFKVGDILCSILDHSKDKIFFIIDCDDKYLYVRECDRVMSGFA